jgi:hypothetical protein
VTGRGLDMTGRVRSVTERRAARVRSVRPACPVDRGTGASGQTRGEAMGASDQSRSDESGHEKPSLDPHCTQTERHV